MSEPADHVEAVEQADSLDELYAQVLQVNVALARASQPGAGAESREPEAGVPPGESTGAVEPAGVTPDVIDPADVLDRIDEYLATLRAKGRELAASENAETFTVGASGGTGGFLKLEVTYAVENEE